MRFYSSSLLLMYDGDLTNDAPRVDIRMIDFAHTTFEQSEGAQSELPDEVCSLFFARARSCCCRPFHLPSVSCEAIVLPAASWLSLSFYAAAVHTAALLLLVLVLAFPTNNQQPPQGYLFGLGNLGDRLRGLMTEGAAPQPPAAASAQPGAVDAN